MMRSCSVSLALLVVGIGTVRGQEPVPVPVSPPKPAPNLNTTPTLVDGQRLAQSNGEFPTTNGLASPGFTDPTPIAPITSDNSGPPIYQLNSVPGDSPGTADPVVRLLPRTERFHAYGWVDGGTLANTSSPGSNFNGPYNAVYRDRPTFNQAYLVMELDRPENQDFGIGGRVDVMYGADYILAQSTGFEKNRDGSPKWNSDPYLGVAIPQAYLDLGNDTLSVQLGHFYTVVGYEGVQSANNFFYSHAYSYQFAGPFTEWGGLLTWKPSSNWELQGGPVNQWNTLDSTQNNVEFLGKAKYTSDAKDWWSSFAIITGNEPNNPAGLPGIVPDVANRTRYSFLVDRKFTDNVEYVFHHWLGAQQNGTANGSTAMWYGIDQYLFYRVSQQVKLGGRIEWFNDANGTRVGLTLPSNPNAAPLPGNYFSFTVGPNFTPHPNVVIRPEVRYDTCQGGSLPFDDGRKSQQALLGTDLIIKF